VLVVLAAFEPLVLKFSNPFLAFPSVASSLKSVAKWGMRPGEPSAAEHRASYRKAAGTAHRRDSTIRASPRPTAHSLPTSCGCGRCPQTRLPRPHRVLAYFDFGPECGLAGVATACRLVEVVVWEYLHRDRPQITALSHPAPQVRDQAASLIRPQDGQRDGLSNPSCQIRYRR